MKLQQHDQATVNNFFAEAKHHLDPVNFAVGVSYLALKDNGVFVLAQARVFLALSKLEIPNSHVNLESIKAGHFLLSEIDSDAEEFLATLVATGKLLTPWEILTFHPPI